MKQVDIYTDGCALGNPGESGAGALLIHGDYAKKVSVYIGKSTNNRAELLAIIHGLEALSEPCYVTIYSDSQITVKCATGEFGRNSNIDLWQQYDNAIARHGSIRLVWIRKDSHYYNHVAHELANKGARTQTNTEEVIKVSDLE